ncbi:glycosyltransferase 87 family protein [Actinoplanes sp. NPDC049118]|uniref:glycosyltransferase 87 family protein n=1 Tax=Actinoplanes sp. NPDC049118 TaxID=3155769 RepID=UPI0033EF3C87
MPARRTTARPATTGSVVVALSCVGILAAITTIAQRYGFSGLAVGRAAVQSWLDGDGLYAYRSPSSQLGTELAPPALFFVSPAVLMPLRLAGWLTALAGVAALGLSLVALVGPVARRYGRRPWPVVLAAGALALTVEPVRATLGLGALDLLVFGMVTADIVALRRSAWARSRAAWWPGRRACSPPQGRTVGDLLRRGWATGAWAGLGTGIATALTVTPAFFIAYLAVTRQWRAAFTAAGAASVAALAALMITPRETAAWFGEVLWRIDRAGPVDAVGNQSLAGVLARIYESATTPVLLWLSFSLLLVAVGFIRARAAHADGDEIAAFTLVGLTAAIVGPVTDTHELVWVLPAMLILVDAAARRRVTAGRALPGRNRRPGLGFAVAAAATYLLFVLAPMWSGHDALSRNSYALAAILLVNALPWRPGVAPAFLVNRWLGRSSSSRRAGRRARTGGFAHEPGVAQFASGGRPGVAGGPLPAATIPPPRDPGR